MEVYATGVRVATTLVAIIGITAHSLVALLTCKKGKHDHSAYVLLMQIYSSCTIVRILTGWWVIYRAQSLPGGHTLIFAYGIGGSLDPMSAGIIQSISNTFSPIIVVLIPTSMAIRALLLFNKSVNKKVVLLTVGVIFVLAAPILVGMIRILMHSPVLTIPPGFLLEAECAPPFAELQHEIEIQLWYVGSNSTYICVPVTFLLRYVMVRKLKKMVTSFSGKVSALHKSFVTLLTFEASVLFIGIIVTILRAVAKEYDDMFPVFGSLLSSFSFPILLTMPMFQGVGCLLLVPYLRNSLLGFFMKSKLSVTSREFSTKQTPVS